MPTTYPILLIKTLEILIGVKFFEPILFCFFVKTF